MPSKYKHEATFICHFSLGGATFQVKFSGGRSEVENAALHFAGRVEATLQNIEEITDGK